MAGWGSDVRVSRSDRMPQSFKVNWFSSTNQCQSINFNQYQSCSFNQSSCRLKPTRTQRITLNPKMNSDCSFIRKSLASICRTLVVHPQDLTCFRKFPLQWLKVDRHLNNLYFSSQNNCRPFEGYCFYYCFYYCYCF